MANTMQGMPNTIEEVLQSAVNEARSRYMSIKDGLIHQCAQYIFYDAQNWAGETAAVPGYIQRNVLLAAEKIDALGLFPKGAFDNIIAMIYRKLAHQTTNLTIWDAYGNWRGWRYTEDESRSWQDGRGRVEYRV